MDKVSRTASLLTLETAPVTMLATVRRAIKISVFVDGKEHYSVLCALMEV